MICPLKSIPLEDFHLELARHRSFYLGGSCSCLGGAVIVAGSGELLEPPLQACPLGAQPRVVAAHAVAVPDGAVEAVEQVAVVAAEVGGLRPELAELPLLAHARPPRRLPVGRRPPPPPLLREPLAGAGSLVVGVGGRRRAVEERLGELLAVRGGGARRRDQVGADAMEQEVVVACRRVVMGPEAESHGGCGWQVREDNARNLARVHAA